MASMYVDDTNRGAETHFIFSSKEIDGYIKSSSKVFDRLMIHDENRENLKARELVQQKNDWIFYAVKKYAQNFSDATVVVFGSTEPYIEAAALVMGAKHVTTLEYNNLTYEHPAITTINKHHFDDVYACNSIHQNAYDIALSVSSFDHDGLGRYGDPLNPDGDLQAMSRAMGLVRPGGLLFLTVPIGPDLVVWNLLRRYGKIRLPLLLDGWEVVEKLFWEETKLTAPEPNFRRSYEPVLVLRKPVNASGWMCEIQEMNSADGMVELETKGQTDRSVGESELAGAGRVMAEEL